MGSAPGSRGCCWSARRSCSCAAPSRLSFFTCGRSCGCAHSVCLLVKQLRCSREAAVLCKCALLICCVSSLTAFPDTHKVLQRQLCCVCTPWLCCSLVAARNLRAPACPLRQKAERATLACERAAQEMERACISFDKASEVAPATRVAAVLFESFQCKP